MDYKKESNLNNTVIVISKYSCSIINTRTVIAVVFKRRKY